MEEIRKTNQFNSHHIVLYVPGAAPSADPYPFALKYLRAAVI